MKSNTIAAGNKAKAMSQQTRSGPGVKNLANGANRAPMIGKGAGGVCAPIKGSNKGGVK